MPAWNSQAANSGQRKARPRELQGPNGHGAALHPSMVTFDRSFQELREKSPSQVPERQGKEQVAGHGTRCFLRWNSQHTVTQNERRKARSLPNVLVSSPKHDPEEGDFIY